MAAIPEGLPAALAVILAISSGKILKKGGLVKKLVAAESLGSTSVICADKTGTLTEGKMKVEQILTGAPEEEFLTAIALANEAVVEEEEGKYKITGDTTDQAKIQAFLDKGFQFKKLTGEYPLITQIPFDSVNKFVASFHKFNDKVFMYISGAPEIIIKLSIGVKEGTVRPISSSDVAKEESQYQALASDGFRMIAAAYREVDVPSEKIAEMKEA